MSKTLQISPTLGDTVWGANQIISADKTDDRFVVDGVRHDVIIAGLELGFPAGATILTHLGVKVLFVDCNLDMQQSPREGWRELLPTNPSDIPTTKTPVSSIPLGDPEE